MPHTFDTTSWSVVLTARDSASDRADEALSRLVQTYWMPVYWYVRRQGYGDEDAKDLTQGFFCRLLARDFLRNVRPDLGRFRTFLLTALKHFLRDEWQKTRGRGRDDVTRVALDFAAAEAAYLQYSSHEEDPCMVFDRQWARALLDSVLRQLAAEYVARGCGDVFETFRECLIVDGSRLNLGEKAASLGMSMSAAKVTVHRLRKRYAKRIRGEIARTVESPEAVDDELHYLFQVVGKDL